MAVSSSDRPEPPVDDDEDPFANMAPARSTKRRRVESDRPQYGTAPPTFVERAAFRPGDEELLEPALAPRRDDSETRLALAAAMPEPELPVRPSDSGVSPTVQLTPTEIAAAHAQEAAKARAKPVESGTRVKPMKPTLPESVSSFGSKESAATPPPNLGAGADASKPKGRKRRAARDKSERIVPRTEYAMESFRPDESVAFDAPKTVPAAPRSRSSMAPRTATGVPGWLWFMAGVVVGVGFGIGFMLVLLG